MFGNNHYIQLLHIFIHSTTASMGEMKWETNSKEAPILE